MRIPVVIVTGQMLPFLKTRISVSQIGDLADALRGMIASCSIAEGPQVVSGRGIVAEFKEEIALLLVPHISSNKPVILFLPENLPDGNESVSIAVDLSVIYGELSEFRQNSPVMKPEDWIEGSNGNTRHVALQDHATGTRFGRFTAASEVHIVVDILR